MLLGWVVEDTLAMLSGLQLVALVYLAVAVSRLRERVAHLEGLLGKDLTQ